MALPSKTSSSKLPVRRDRSKAALLQRNYEKLSHKLVDDLFKVWKDHGQDVLKEVAEKRPDLFLEAVSKLLVKIPAAIDSTQSRKEFSKITNNTVVINEGGGDAPGTPPRSILEQLRAKTTDADFEPVDD